LPQPAAGGDEFTASDGSFTIRFPSEHTHPLSMRVYTDATSATVAVQTVQSWGGGALATTFRIMSTAPVNALTAASLTRAYCVVGQAKTEEESITISGHPGTYCHTHYGIDYAFVYANSRVFVFTLFGHAQGTGTSADFTRFVASFKLRR
jgi:hypothetical protein